MVMDYALTSMFIVPCVRLQAIKTGYFQPKGRAAIIREWLCLMRNEKYLA